MIKPIRYFIYFLMIVIGFIAMYTLLNAGNPEGLFRPFFPDPDDDVIIAFVSSIIVFILGFFVFFSRDQESFRHLVEINGDRIKKLRKKGKSEEEIAESILQAMGIRKGYRYNMARKKLLIHLSHFS